MRQRICQLLLPLALVAAPILADQPPSWAELVDPEAQHYEDPYADLDHKQLADLVTVAQLRERLKEGQVTKDRRATHEARLARLELELTEAGIDVDWILSQRWVVAERRKRAATSGNPALDGAEVTLIGFAIPAPPAEDGTPVAYLVPERGMCSHMPPPPPNQMIRVRLTSDWVPTQIYEPVRLTGHLTIDPTSQTMRVVDGNVVMHATYGMDTTVAQPLGFRSPASTAAWARAAALHERLPGSAKDH